MLDAHPRARVHQLANPALRRTPVSPVFHGRDLFGPAAGHLARGLAIDEVGPAVSDPVRLELPAKTRRSDGWQGTVLWVDRFGNLTTDLRQADLVALAGPELAGLEVLLGGRRLPLVRTYSAVPVGEPCALLGSSDRLEIAVHRGRADSLLDARVGASVVLRLAR